MPRPTTGLVAWLCVASLGGHSSLAAPDEPAVVTGMPRDIGADELAGRVVDAEGKPIEGVEVHAWPWVQIPNHITRTDRDGQFRLRKLPKGEMVPVRLRKEGYETKYDLDRGMGPPGWLAVLRNNTSFEGRVLRPDGSPAADVLIRADSGRGGPAGS